MYRLAILSEQISSKDNPIQLHRNNSTLDKQDWKETIYGHNFWIRDRQIDFMMKNLDKYRHYHLMEANKKQQRLKSAEQMFFTYDNRLLSHQQFQKDNNLLTVMGNAIYSYSPGFSVKNGVHLMLYYKTLHILGTQRHQKFLDRAVHYQDIGCFALTQLLHGSNVKGLLTEAHYDHKNKQFILHSPSKDAMKFWIGASANVANICIVWAQLYIEGKCYGVHTFVTPLRDQRTHNLYPRIMIGDCGMKNGVNQVDNGFIMFDHYRIPADNLLNKLSGVDENGKFYNHLGTQEKRFGLQLGALSGGRVYLIANSITLALNALAIATRYACIRKQFGPPGKPEITLFQYPLTKHRLVPALAQAVVYQTVGYHLSRIWDSNTATLLNPENPLIQQIHALSSCLKPLSTWFTSKVISECRQMLGGHGYSAFSRLNSMYHQNDINITWEGDNNILLQQTGKFVLETAQLMTKGQKIEVHSLSFLNNLQSLPEINQKNLRCLDFLTILFQNRVFNKIQESGMRLLELKMKKMAVFDIWNNSQVHFIHPLALQFGELYYLQTARAILKKFKKQNNTTVFQNCIRLWVYQVLATEGYGDQQTKQLIKQLIAQYTKVVSVEAIGILDVMTPPSELIGSPFADENGEGMEKYLNLIWNAKDTFKKVDWYESIVERKIF